MNQQTRRAVLILASCLLGNAHAVGQADMPGDVPADAPMNAPAGGAALAAGRTQLPPSIEIARLIDLAAQRLRLTIDYDPAILPSQPITIRLGEPLSDPELWAFLNRALALRGLATVKGGAGNAYVIARLADAPGIAELQTRLLRDARVEDQPGDAPGGVHTLPAGFETALVQVRHRAAKDIAAIVDKALSKPAGSIVPLGDSNLLLISETGGRMARVVDLIAQLDVDAQPMVEEIAISNSTSTAIATLATQVIARRDLVSGKRTPGEIVAVPDQPRILLIAPRTTMDLWRGVVADLDRREQVQTIVYAPRVFTPREVADLLEREIGPSSLPVKWTSDDRWRVVIEEITGSLVVTATPAQHDRIRQTLQRLERTPGTTSRPVRSFVIKNRPATEVQTILEDLNRAGALRIDAEPQGTNSSMSPATGSATTANPINAAAPTSIPPTAGASAIPPAQPSLTPLGAVSTSSTVSTPSSPPAASAIPGRPRPDASTLSITVDASTNTLIVMAEPRTMAQIESLLPTLDVRQAQVSLEVLIVSLTDNQTLDLGVELEKLTRSGDTRIRLSSLFGIGSRGSGGDRTIGDGSGFTAFVLNPGDFSIVLRALETINQGRSMSMPRLLVTNNQQATLDSTLDQPFTTTSQPTSGGVLTSFGGSSQAGTQVTLKPQIAEGDHLRLDYSVSLSAFVGASAGPNVPPPKQQNKISSAATLPDGYTVAVGGIEVTTDGTGLSQVPGVGRIPIIGEAFKNRSKTQGRSRFYVFIRANILRHRGFEDLKYLSDRQSTAAQVDDGFPDLAPRVIR